MIQTKLNLSIQMPNDETSVIDIPQIVGLQTAFPIKRMDTYDKGL